MWSGISLTPRTTTSIYELFAAIVVNLVATVLKFGDRSPLGSTMLATSLVADIQFVAAAASWGYLCSLGGVIAPHGMVTVVSLAVGALVANVVSVLLLVIETASLRR